MSLCILMVLKYGYNINGLTSSELKGRLEDLEISSLQHLGDYLKKFKNLIVREKINSRKYNYKITHPGEEKAIEIIKELVLQD